MSGYQFSRQSKKVPLVSTAYRKIQTAIPSPGSEKLLEKLDRLESRSMHGQVPLIWDKAEDFLVYDSSENCWIDFTSGIFFSNVGHSNPRVLDAIKKVMEKPMLGCYAYPNEIRANYLEKLLAFAGPPFEKGFLLSAGTETTEAALKLMRMKGQDLNKRRLGIICVENNWHGRTMGAQMLSSNLSQKEWIGYQDKDIHHIPFPYPWDLKRRSGEDFLYAGLENLTSKGISLELDICGIMLETFQGWGAVFYPRDFVQSIKKICTEHNILLTFDEMQSGFARTGETFGYKHYDVEPDLICCGKGMGGGVPISGVLGLAEIMDLPEIGSMSSTHSANPLVCAAGHAVIEEIEAKNLVNEAARKGKILFTALNSIKTKYEENISYALGNGLISAILFKDPETGKPDSLFPSKLTELCMQKGLLVAHTGRESIKIAPPLTINDEALLEGLDVLDEAIRETLLL